MTLASSPIITTLALPTLPSIDALGLPRHGTPISPSDAHDAYNPLNAKRLPSSSTPFYRDHTRRASTFSSSSSRTPSPSPSDFSSISSETTSTSVSSSSKTSSRPPAAKLRLRSHQSSDCLPNISAFARANETRSLLLTGDALRHVRGPKRTISRAARVHPYRILRATELERRGSVSSDSD
ncbi:hypothetical protein HGRIS_011301 [Hohenbuehelia grisea]|uniref:Uncharacterized protein n=1 Tax=Hohenbuehelia grisea TaxID=104357 RepID=A0ABR3JUW1_9AGAR